MRVLLLFAATLLFESLCGADVRLQVLDQSRAPFQNVLVIVKYLEDGGETGRYLSDAAGRIPTLQLKSGLVGYPFDSGSHKMLWSRESIYQEANPEVTALARRGAA